MKKFKVLRNEVRQNTNEGGKQEWIPITNGKGKTRVIASYKKFNVLLGSGLNWQQAKQMRSENKGSYIIQE